MSIITIEQLKAKFEGGDYPGSADYINLIDTLAATPDISGKAPLASPTFTGTVSGIDKTMVGLSNVDNTTDALKPVSTATQTALNLKAPLASPTFTGTVSAAALTLSGDLIVQGTTTTIDSNTIAVKNAFVFEGVTTDDYETTLTIVDPTADRTITLPNVTGTVVTTGDAGTVTSTMILDGTILNADINASAAIDWTKLGISSTVSSTEIGYVDGVTSAIQTQLDAKIGQSTAINPTLLDAKGDILVATAADTPDKLTLGTNGYYLKANSGTATGLEWAAVVTDPTPTVFMLMGA